MSDRRRLLMQLREEASTLPDGYYPCEYIESDGQQYINTMCEWRGDYRVVIDAQVLNKGCLFGSGEYDGDDSRVYKLAFYENSLDLEYGWRSNTYTFTGAIGPRRVYDWNKDTLFINGTQFINFNGVISVLCNDPILFAFGRYGVDDSEVYDYISAKLYSCQMYSSSGKLLRDYVPCFSAADGKFGLYDKVSKTFFGSKTTSPFRGKLITPSGYSAVEYIYGDGNAYIDTGYKHNQTTRVIMDVEPVGTPTENKFLFEGYQANGYLKGIYWNYSNSCWSVDYASSSARQNISTAYAQRLYIDYNRNRCRFNNTYISFTAKTFQSTQNEYILAVNNNGTTTRITPAKLYFYCIFDNDTLVRLFAPCINSSNVYGLYDLVNKKFYQSAGTSQFGEEPVVYDFDYTGGEQSVLLKAGNYKLEVWGAEGGKGNPFLDAEASAGKGGYSVGVYSVTEPTTVYINVGGKGQSGADSINNTNTTKGGYNGGGNGGGSINTYCYPGGAGGGATHIATKAGLLVSLLSSTSNILIVAGGGGGEGGPSYAWDNEEGLYFLDWDSQGSGGIGGGIGGGAGIEGHPGMVRDGLGGAAGSINWAGSGGSGGNATENARERSYYVSGAGGGGGGGYYAGGGGGSGAVSGMWPTDGNAGKVGGFGIGGAGGNYVSEDGYYTGPGGGGGGGSGYLAPSLTSASSTAGQRSGNGYARITKI